MTPVAFWKLERPSLRSTRSDCEWKAEHSQKYFSCLSKLPAPGLQIGEIVLIPAAREVCEVESLYYTSTCSLVKFRQNDYLAAGLGKHWGFG